MRIPPIQGADVHNSANFGKIYMVKTSPIFNNLFRYTDQSAVKVSKIDGIRYIEDTEILKNKEIMSMIKSNEYLQELAKRKDIFIRYFEYKAPANVFDERVVTHRYADLWGLSDSKAHVVRERLSFFNVGEPTSSLNVVSEWWWAFLIKFRR
ncbi:hypothetical protein J6S88_00890 [bacterium]|nr:hypothetical protein [bacterium]